MADYILLYIYLIIIILVHKFSAYKMILSKKLGVKKCR